MMSFSVSEVLVNFGLGKYNTLYYLFSSATASYTGPLSQWVSIAVFVIPKAL